MWIKYSILVVYNRDIDDSISYRMLKRRNIPVIVCDNSTISNQNRNEVERDKNIYLSMNGNRGLSYAYNKALDWIDENQGHERNGYVVFFDDDTQISEEFFCMMEKKIEEYRPDILLPVVLDDLGIMSPVQISSNKYCTRCKDPFHVSKERISGINSGMVVSLQIYRQYRYDERLFLDYVDHNFLWDMKQQKKNIQVVDVKLQQASSSLKDDAQKAIVRLRIFKKDINVFYGDRILERFVYYYVMIRRKLHYIKLYKDISVLWKC